MNRSDLIFYLLGKRYRFDLAKMVRFVTASQYWTEEQIYEYQLSMVKKSLSMLTKVFHTILP